MARADHQPYVQAVSEAVADTGLDVFIAWPMGRSPAVRTAVIALAPPVGGPWADAEQDLEMVWDEVYGWKAVLPGEAGSVDWYMGQALVPAPARVARWIDLLLAHPELTPSQEGGPSRLPETDDEAFEAQLAAYTAASA